MFEELDEKVRSGEINVREAFQELVRILMLSPAQRMRLSDNKEYENKFGWWKRKILENIDDIPRLIRLCTWLSRQPDLFLNERAILGALIRRLKEERLAQFKRQLK